MLEVGVVEAVDVNVVAGVVVVVVVVDVVVLVVVMASSQTYGILALHGP